MWCLSTFLTCFLSTFDTNVTFASSNDPSGFLNPLFWKLSFHFSFNNGRNAETNNSVSCVPFSIFFACSRSTIHFAYRSLQLFYSSDMNSAKLKMEDFACPPCLQSSTMQRSRDKSSTRQTYHFTLVISFSVAKPCSVHCFQFTLYSRVYSLANILQGVFTPQKNMHWNTCSASIYNDAFYRRSKVVMCWNT